VSDLGLINLVVVPVGLGLLGFIEPCSIGSSLLFIKFLEGKGAARKLAETFLFAGTRALAIGALGVVAAFLGSAFLGYQRAAWVGLGALYVLIGGLYVFRRGEMLMVMLGPSLARLSGLGGSAGLGALFGLNIPACAAPLLVALLAAAAAGGAAGAAVVDGFVTLGLFGLALSLPLVVAVLIAPVRRLLDRLAALCGRFPAWAGVVLVGLGLWSIGFGLFAEVNASSP